MKQPYKNWTRHELYNHLVRQAELFGYSEDYIVQIEIMVFDMNWNPMQDFNGCNMVQDHIHPFLPCFIHDYRWIMNFDNNDNHAREHDKEFYNNLIQCGVSDIRAKMYFCGVRLGWLFYYRWK